MSEIDDSLEKLTALCMGLEIPPSTAASMGAMGLKAIGTAIAEQAKKAGRGDAELTRLLAIEAAAKERDAIVMANARRLIKAKNLTSNGRLYMELFGTGFGTARSRCVKDLGISPESNKTSYDEMLNHISADPVLAINPIGDPK